MDQPIDEDNEPQSMAKSIAEQYLSSGQPTNEEDNPYNAEMMQDRYRNKTTVFSPRILQEVDNSLLKYKSKQAIRIAIYNLFDSDIFMSNLTKPRSSWKEQASDPMTKALNNIDKVMLEIQAGIARTDKNKPDTFIILKNIRSHLEFILTRAVGPDREGIINRKELAESTQNVTSLERVNPTPAPKKSFYRR